MLHLYIERCAPELFLREGRVSHFAPEVHVRRFIERNPKLCCVSTDYGWEVARACERPAVQTDMQHLGFANDSFDLIFCLHVLEHVPDDRQGIAELHRVLKPGGTAYIMVPFMMGWTKTVEFGRPDPAIYDHVRGYAPHDFEDRLSPFQYEKIVPELFLLDEELLRYGIPTESQVIFRCRKDGNV